MTVNGVFTLSGDTFSSNGHLLYVSSTGSVVRTSGEVVGTLTKYVPTGSPTVTFEVGDASTYTPATLVFNSVSVAGDVSASTTPGDHPQIATSTIDPAQSVNRYWTLSGSTIVFTTYTRNLQLQRRGRGLGRHHGRLHRLPLFGRIVVGAKHDQRRCRPRRPPPASAALATSNWACR